MSRWRHSEHVHTHTHTTCIIIPAVMQCRKEKQLSPKAMIHPLQHTHSGTLTSTPQCNINTALLRPTLLWKHPIMHAVLLRTLQLAFQPNTVWTCTGWVLNAGHGGWAVWVTLRGRYDLKYFVQRYWISWNLTILRPKTTTDIKYFVFLPDCFLSVCLAQ